MPLKLGYKVFLKIVKSLTYEILHFLSKNKIKRKL